jgi:hypothetical protein
MKWFLIYVGLTLDGEGVQAFKLAETDSMANCFVERELALVDMGSEDGYPPVGTQLVCLYAKEQDN